MSSCPHDTQSEVLQQSEEQGNNGSYQSSIVNDASNCSPNEVEELESSGVSSKSSRRDENLLSRTLSECGIDAYGCIFIEIWVLSPDGQRLIRPSGGYWIDPIFLHSLKDPSIARELVRHAAAHAIGEDLVGTLFEETFRWRHSNNSSNRRRVHWRQIQSLMNDPYYVQPSLEKRMEILNNLGIGIVGTLPFHLQGQHGIVMFMSRSTVDVDKLRSNVNEKYLTGAADLIAAAYAIRIPRRECIDVRKEMFQNATRKVKDCIFGMRSKGENFASFVRQLKDDGEITGTDRPSPTSGGLSDSGFEEKRKISFFNVREALQYWKFRVTHHLEHSFRKWSGAGLHGPPRQTISECVSIFTGILCVLVVLLRMNEALHEDDALHKIAFDGVWFTGPLCIIFSLTPAPVGQPRQIICAHIWCALVGYAFQQIPQGNYLDEDHPLYDESRQDLTKTVPLYWIQSLSTAFATSGLAYFGIIHPPSTALAFKFADKTNNWKIGSLAGILLGDLIMIFMSIIILNLQPRKQYPMFWFGFKWRPLEVEKLSPSAGAHQSNDKNRDVKHLNGSRSTCEKHKPKVFGASLDSTV